jgi:hypothetical protein
MDGKLFASFPVPFSFPRCVSLLFPLELSNPNISAHRLCAQENTHEMPPKKKLGKELPVEGSSQAAGTQVLETTQAII